jgi:hypothetical protein
MAACNRQSEVGPRGLARSPPPCSGELRLGLGRVLGGVLAR